jgi:phosphoglycerate-specific signal transduction histidine kinase
MCRIWSALGFLVREREHLIFPHDLVFEAAVGFRRKRGGGEHARIASLCSSSCWSKPLSEPGIQPLPFYTAKGNGMGIGLAICRSVIAAHGGTLVIQDGEQGARICFNLPLAPASAG